MKGHLYLDDSQAAQGRRSARLDTGGQSRELWFDTRGRSLSTEAGADPFLIATLMFWMQEGKDVHVHGSVSRVLLEGLTEWQMAWARWRPERYSQVEITVDEVRDDRPVGRNAILAFSGGIDAAYSFHRHWTKRASWRTVDIGAVLMAQGFDIPLAEEEQFSRAKARVERMLADTPVPVLTVATNFRDLPHVWEDVHALPLVACLTLFTPEFSIGMFGSSEPYQSLVLPWGSNPMTDPLLSSGRMQVRHDGAGASRTQKITALADWTRGVEHLRVCWQGEARDSNCGLCEKCWRTRLNFEVAGAAPLCFPAGLEEPEDPLLKSAEQFSEWTLLAKEARAAGNLRVSKLAERVVRSSRRRNAAQRRRARKPVAQLRRLVRRIRGSSGQMGRA